MQECPLQRAWKLWQFEVFFIYIIIIERKVVRQGSLTPFIPACSWQIYSPEAAWLASSLAAATPLPGAPSTAEEEADPAPDVAAPVVAAAPVDAVADAAAEAPVAELSRCPADAAAVVSDVERFVPPLCPRLLIPELLRLLLTKLRHNQVYGKYKAQR